MSIVQLGKWIEEFLDRATDQIPKGAGTLGAPTATPTKSKQDVALAQKVQQLRELYADAPNEFLDEIAE